MQRGRMTIAIGYRCYLGVILSADTLVVIGEEAHEGSKLSHFWAQSGAFAFAHASEDAEATVSLLADIHDTIQTSEIGSHRDLGKLVKGEMTQWRQAFGRRRPPSHGIILGTKLKKERECGLFYCEPPNTFREIGDYKAVGSGAAITDFIHKYFFSHFGGEYINADCVLRRIAYMIYRAKKDTTVCGKRTEAIVVHTAANDPTFVSTRDLAEAERMSTQLDELLSTVAEFSLDSTPQNINHNTQALMEMLNSAVNLRSTRFRDGYGDEIKLDGV
jgi:hypothetical protein